MTQTSHAFQTEVTQLLHLMVHSLYSEREIFLRELVSNASDACDKLRFKAITEPKLLTGESDLKVTVRGDGEAKTLIIEDNGIGLTEAEAMENLGTIARSGTKAFVEGVQAADKKDVASLIGQFGVGFYSAFMVAERIVVESRSASASADDGVRWESTGDGSYTTESISRPQRGTTITLHLKDDATEFAEPWRLRTLIKKYSDYVTYPIFTPKPDGDDKEKGELEQANAGQALWTRSKSDITDEQYTEFYHGACHQWDEPATRIHVTVEGTMAFSLLLFIPSQKPMDLFDRGRRGLSLYVRRVFIMDDCEELLPEYLRFVRGVVDSDDLPLNVSREILQDQPILEKLRKQITKRVIDHLAKLAASEDEADQKAFATINDTFGAVMREGIVNDFANKDKLLDLARFRSTWTIEQEQPEDAPAVTTSFQAYLDRRPEGQESIYYLTAPSQDAALASPLLEGYRKRGYEVLLMTDPVDEWVTGQVTEFKDVKLVAIAKGEAELDDEDAKKALKKTAKEYKKFLGFCEERLSGGVKEVRLTHRLTDSPCCLVSDAQGMSVQMEEMMRAYGRDVPAQERILELNPDHVLVQKLKAKHEAGEQDDVAEAVSVLRDQALLAEGARIADPAGFAKRIQTVLARALS